MRHFMRSLAGIVLSALVASANALPIADSVADFSSIQGGNGWSYGYFNAGAAPGASYTTGAFVAFDTFSAVDNRCGIAWVRRNHLIVMLTGLEALPWMERSALGRTP